MGDSERGKEDREREGGEKVSSRFLVLSYGSFGHPNPPVSLPEVRGQVRWSTCGSQASI